MNITSVVEQETGGDFLLRWEVNPDTEGMMYIFSSHTDAYLENFVPIGSVPINDRVFRVRQTTNPNALAYRNFFQLRTATASSGIVSNRVMPAQMIRNFRDAGGYFTTDNRQMRWGMLFRSGDLSSANLHDQALIKQLGIRTIVDFRSERTARLFPIFSHPDINIVSLPLPPMDLIRLEELKEDDSFTRSDAIRYMQQMYVRIIENQKEEFAIMFQLLTDINNFPVLLTESLGKDGVGLAIYFIQYSLGIPHNLLMEDYMFNSRKFRETTRSLIDDAQDLSESMQQAITALLTVNRAYLNYAIQHIRQTYGSVSSYLETELGVTSGVRSALRRNLLYAF